MAFIRRSGSSAWTQNSVFAPDLPGKTYRSFVKITFDIPYQKAGNIHSIRLRCTCIKPLISKGLICFPVEFDESLASRMQ